MDFDKILAGLAAKAIPKFIQNTKSGVKSAKIEGQKIAHKIGGKDANLKYRHLGNGLYRVYRNGKPIGLCGKEDL